jgi:folate-binding protein YgfZ
MARGTDAASFLQGQLSQDVEALEVGDSAWSLLLSPQGKVDAFGRITRTDDEAFIFEVEAGFGEAAMARLSRFRLRVDVELSLTSVGESADDEAAERARIEAGIPRLGAELDESTIPAEAGTWLIDHAVSFTKGCYVGQELVARVDSRGSNTPRRLRRLRPADGSTLERGAEIVLDGSMVGRVTSAASGVALGYVGRAVDVPATVEVGGTPVAVEAL